MKKHCSFKCKDCGFVFIGEKEDVKRVRAAHKIKLMFGQETCPMQETKFGTFARPELARYIDTLERDVYYGERRSKK